MGSAKVLMRNLQSSKADSAVTKRRPSPLVDNSASTREGVIR